MLNYISAEWYKLRQTKGIFLAFGLLLALIALLFLPSMWVVQPMFMAYTGVYMMCLLLGFFLAPIFAVRAFDDQYGRGTLKNEVVFGIPRHRIYLGKLTFAGLLGTGAALVVLGFYLLLCTLMGCMAEEHARLCVDLCVQGTFLVLPLWLASLSFSFLLQVVIKSSGGAVAVNYLILLFATPISLMREAADPSGSQFLNFMNRWFFMAPFRSLFEDWETAVNSLATMPYSWVVGLGWIAATSLLGMAIFSRKEIH